MQSTFRFGVEIFLFLLKIHLLFLYQRKFIFKILGLQVDITLPKLLKDTVSPEQNSVRRMILVQGVRRHLDIVLIQKLFVVLAIDSLIDL